VGVGIDKPWHHDAARRVDDRSAPVAAADVGAGADGDDPVAPDRHRAPVKDRVGVVEGQDGAAFDEDVDFLHVLHTFRRPAS